MIIDSGSPLQVAIWSRFFLFLRSLSAVFGIAAEVFMDLEEEICLADIDAVG